MELPALDEISSSDTSSDVEVKKRGDDNRPEGGEKTKSSGEGGNKSTRRVVKESSDISRTIFQVCYICVFFKC